MNSQTDIVVPDLNRKTISKDLDQMIDLVGNLCKQSRRIGLQALSALVQTIKPRAHILELRRSHTEFMDAIGQIRSLQRSCHLVANPAMRHRLDQLLSAQQMGVLDAFSGNVREICALLSSQNSTLPSTIVESVRFIEVELEQALTEMRATLKAALQVAHMQERDLAYIDELTSLPNRRALYGVETQVAASIAGGHQVTLLQLDLDRFKQVNDNLGHAAGDATLCRVAGILKSALRANDFVARVGGDEFVLLLFTRMSVEEAASRATDIANRIAVPFTYHDKPVQVGATIGIASSSMDNCQTLDRLLANADLALYSAKAHEKGGARLFAPQMRTRLEETEIIVEQILTGIQANEFVPYFQPQVEGRTGKLVGLETLMRWVHPDRGVLTPIHFLKIAEQQGLLEQMEDVVNRRALTAMRRWQDQNLPIPQVSLNLTADRLNSTELVAKLTRSVAEFGLVPGQIGLEILESAMIEVESGNIISNIRDLSRRGFRIELDDFGTGHASIANLRHFKVDRIKIDRSFVKDVHLYSELSKITGAMIGLAHSLRVDALGEGVETPEERLVLNALGCDHIQGFGVARPMPEAEVDIWVRRTQRTRIVPSTWLTTEGRAVSSHDLPD